MATSVRPCGAVYSPQPQPRPAAQQERWGVRESLEESIAPDLIGQVDQSGYKDSIYVMWLLVGSQGTQC